jgi:hypothetical protein
MEALCYALLAGYPVMGGAIVALWKAHTHSQAALLAEKERRVRELETLKELLERRTPR